MTSDYDVWLVTAEVDRQSSKHREKYPEIEGRPESASGAYRQKDRGHPRPQRLVPQFHGNHNNRIAPA